MKHFVLGGEYSTHCRCLAPNTFTVALDGIWSIRRNLPVGGMIPGQQSRNCSLPQTKYYSRHGGLRSKTLDPTAPQTAEGVPQLTNKRCTVKHLNHRSPFLLCFCPVTLYLSTVCHPGTHSPVTEHTSTDTREVHT